jgi:uncharacterized protein
MTDSSVPATAAVDPVAASFPAISRDAASAPFFDATARGRIALRCCDGCGTVRGAEVAMCTACASDDAGWFDAVGTGTIVSWIVLHAKPAADGSVAEPRVIVTVELSEGPWMVSALLGTPPHEVRAGMPVIADFVRPADSEAIPVFRTA